MKLSSLVYLLFSSAAVAENLLPNGDFSKGLEAPILSLTNQINPQAMPGWRCFSADHPTRVVQFQIIHDDVSGSNGMRMEMTSNPDGSTKGRIGFDIDQAKLPAAPGSQWQLSFQAKLANSKTCAIMAILAAFDAKNALIGQSSEIYTPNLKLQGFQFNKWTVPERATQVNVIFNLVADSGGQQPIEPAGVIIEQISLTSDSIAESVNLLPNGDFAEGGGGPESVDITNAINTQEITGWRCFTVGAPRRMVHFEVVHDAASASNALRMEIISNPSGEPGGRIGFDIDSCMLPVHPGDQISLKFKAKLATSRACAVMATIAGFREGSSHGTQENLVKQIDKVFTPNDTFQTFEIPAWTVPPEAAEINIGFNLVQDEKLQQPVDPCGIVVGSISVKAVK